MDAPDLLHGLTPAQLAELTHVSIYTARRWKHGARISPPARALLELALAGELGGLAPAWHGFKVHGDRLWTPHGFAVRPGEVCAIPYRCAQIGALERALAHPAQWDWLELNEAADRRLARKLNRCPSASS